MENLGSAGTELVVVRACRVAAMTAVAVETITCRMRLVSPAVVPR